MAQNHDQMRLSVCCSCQKPGCKRMLTPQLLDAAKRFLFKDFELDDPKLPIGLCDSCRGKLMRNTDPATSPTYSQWIADSEFDKDPCSCYICCFHRSKKYLVGKPKEKPPDPTITICKTCFRQVTPGPHPCFLSNRVSNLLQWIPSDVIQQLASHIILEKSDQNNNPDEVVKLKREKGRRLRVYLKKKKRKKNSQFQVSHFNLDKLKVKLKLSKTKARVLALGLRHVTGSRKAVASGYAEHLVQTSRDQEKFFTTAEIKVKNSSKKVKRKFAKMLCMSETCRTTLITSGKVQIF